MRKTSNTGCTERQHTQRQRRSLLPPSADNCRRKCRTQFIEGDRGNIYEEYWNMHYDIQRQWLLSKTRKQPIQRKWPSTSARKGKYCSVTYSFLRTSGKEIQVCQTFFLRTFGYSSKRVDIQLWDKCIESVGGMNITQSHKRGRYITANKKDHSIIVTHIKKYNPQVSHYRREHTPNRSYISPETTLRNMY